jgi:hypothetical protein
LQTVDSALNEVAGGNLVTDTMLEVGGRNLNEGLKEETLLRLPSEYVPEPLKDLV